MSRLLKGIVSAAYKSDNKATVILPECDGIVTKPLPIYSKGNTSASANSKEGLQVNDFVIVMNFSDDYNDSVIMEKQSGGSSSPTVTVEAITNIELDKILT